MEQRALIAVVISLLVLILYQEVVLRYVYPPQPQEQEEVNETPGTGVTPASAPKEPEAELAAPAPAAAAGMAAAEERRITVETEFYKATFTSVGARLASLQLKKYRTTVAPDSSPLEMVIPGKGGELPFGVELRDGQILSDSGAPYTVKGEALDLKDAATGSLDFIWQGESGTIEKRFVFQGGRYEFEATVSARNFPAQYKEVAVAWDKVADVAQEPGAEVIFDRTLYLDGHKLTEDVFDKLAAGKILPNPQEQNGLGFAGYAGKHFLAAMAPADGDVHRLWLKLRDHTVEEKVLFPLSAASGEHTIEVYVGPKDFDALEGIGHGLSRAVNMGWSSFIAVPLLHILKLSHRFSSNYGIDIILLTVLIKLLFVPLTQRSFKSMRAMQKLQPQMTKIRERFKDNSEQMNKEIMELYRRHKVNPLGGCLPMILQIPVFIGLYQALLNAVELRHAPFMLWINDLSAPDRLGALQLPFVQHPGIPVLTLLMGVSMFLQQWMSPSAGDPAQQRVMMIMPLMFTFMFVNFPAGLALYWLVNNLLTIAQQYYINRTAT
jgi:YidC/Oxa1 family membrane protein insertase